MALKEFPDDGTSRPALLDIARGDFAFVAGEMAKAGHIEIDTPFANIRGRWRAGGIGTLSLVSLFFAVMEKVQAAHHLMRADWMMSEYPSTTKMNHTAASRS